MRTLKDPQGKYGATLVAVSTIGIDRELEARRVEASLHAHWASQRVSGEWFKLTRADLDSFHQLVADIRAGLARVYEYPEETASARRARARAVNNYPPRGNLPHHVYADEAPLRTPHPLQHDPANPRPAGLPREVEARRRDLPVRARRVLRPRGGPRTRGHP